MFFPVVFFAWCFVHMFLFFFFLTLCYSCFRGGRSSRKPSAGLAGAAGYVLPRHLAPPARGRLAQAVAAAFAAAQRSAPGSLGTE